MILSLVLLMATQVATTTTATVGTGRTPFLAPGQRPTPRPPPPQKAPPPPSPPASPAPRPETPQPTPQPRFGERRGIYLDAGFGFELEHVFENDAQPATTQLRISPRLGYFLAEDLAVLTSLELSHRVQGERSETGFGLAVGLAKNIPLNAMVSLFPRAEVGVVVVAVDRTNREGSTVTGLVGELALPVLLHVASHLFIGLGPRLDLAHFPATDTTPSLGYTNLGLQVLIGGWL